MPALGALLCLASAAAFGTMAVFGKLAYEEGATVGTLLAVRFGLAAALFWGAAVLSGALRELRTLDRRDLRLALALGAVGYAAQAACYFAALERMDAAVLTLLLYTFPGMVAIAAVLIGRERASRRTAATVLLAFCGTALIVAGAGTGAIDAAGAALALTAAAVYTAYILTSQGVSGRVSPVLVGALVCSGAASTLTAAGLAGGALDFGAVSAEGFGWLGAIAAVSTVGAIGLFFAGLHRVGPTAAAVFSTLEVPVAVVLAVIVFGESLAPVQVAGGALVVGALLLPRAA